ncbi:hypothetical protein D1B31_08035 [Neobacillus notoginsengisoli]|uniref:Uncharacterized protein n=1 Tax=Neobacillus notoginsengisoli TaxID=1578198 RepID=A0A417YWD9_9BACI|nr:hypothetical protein [Neobacillus notoginsengisoli]RHW41656.1 hypothetical protein D1B31_08035 [Neobacillus notoginsengisoli]
MTEEEMEDIFSVYGHYSLSKKLKYPLHISGALDDVETTVLESFFSWYSFDEDKPLYFDNFLYHFTIFKMIKERNILPEIY